MGGKTLTGSQTYTLVIDPDTSLEEIVDVTLYSSGNTLTITRNRDGSSAVAHSAGAVVRQISGMSRDGRPFNRIRWQYCTCRGCGQRYRVIRRENVTG